MNRSDPRLPSGITEDQLRDAVAGASSWRGVLRALGRTSPRLARQLRDACVALEIDSSHFGGSRIRDELLRAAVPAAAGWDDLLEDLGLSRESGSARARVRRQCIRLGIDLGHLSPATAPTLARAFGAPAQLAHLRSAAASLVAGALALRGYAVSWPLEPTAYDLVADSELGLQRIQVKSTTWRQGGAWACKLTRSKPGSGGGRAYYSAEEVDYFACVDGDSTVYLIPVAVVEGLSVIYLRAYDRFRLTESENDLGRADRT